MTRIPERKNVKQIYKWDLTALIDGDAQWETVFGKVKEEAKRLSSFKGALSDDGKLLEFFRERDAAMQTLLRLYLYAHMSNHTDTRADKYYFDEPFGKNCALVMGSERYGISREWYDGTYQMIAIPMEGSCDSLNVGVAATVLAYEAVKKNKFIPQHLKP